MSPATPYDLTTFVEDQGRKKEVKWFSLLVLSLFVDVRRRSLINCVFIGSTRYSPNIRINQHLFIWRAQDHALAGERGPVSTSGEVYS